MIKLSRSKIELSIECPRCFWFDVKYKIGRPPGFPFTLNNAIDFLLKKEFDQYRAKVIAHPFITDNKIDAIPYGGPEMDGWRHNFTGVQVEHAPSGFLVFGAVDDVWVNGKKELIVVDYKATGSAEHHIYDSYKRQMEIYQWLLRGRGLPVSETGYFVFARANKDDGFADRKLSFKIFLEPLLGDDSWVEDAVMNAKKIYDSPRPPVSGAECDYCSYVARRRSA